MEDYAWMPEENRPGGKEELHTDWPWPLNKIKRVNTYFECDPDNVPMQMEGNQDYWCEVDTGFTLSGFTIKSFNKTVGDYIEVLTEYEKRMGILAGRFAPMPIPPRGQWQKSMMTIDGKVYTYRAKRFESGLYVATGPRWTNPTVDSPYSYYEKPALGFRFIKGD